VATRSPITTDGDVAKAQSRSWRHQSPFAESDTHRSTSISFTETITYSTTQSVATRGAGGGTDDVINKRGNRVDPPVI
jgi:hypothetical protein